MLAKFSVPKIPKISRVRYTIGGFKGIRADLGDNGNTLDYCCYGYNIRLLEGRLINGPGIDSAVYQVGNETVSIPSLLTRTQFVNKMHWFPHSDPDTGEKRDELLTYGSGKTLFTYPLFGGGSGHTQISNIHGTVPEIEFINYHTGGKDRVFCYLGSGGLIEYDGTTSEYHSQVPGFSSVCMLCDRVFGIDYNDRNKIHFSAPLNPRDFTDAGEGGSFSLMDEGGPITKIIAYNNAIYVFRDFAVHRIVIYGKKPGEYLVTKILSTGDRIEGGTVATNGSLMCFVAGNKLYVSDFEGLSIRYAGVTALVDDFTGAVGVISGVKYYLSAHLKTRGESIADEATAENPLVRNGILVIDLATDRDLSVFRGTDVKQFLPIYDSELKIILVSFGNSPRKPTYGILTNDGRFYGAVLPKLWQSPTVTLGDMSRLKRMRRIYVRSCGDVRITVTMGGKAILRYAYGNPRTQDVIFNESVGDDISLKLSSESGSFYIEPPELIFDLFRRYA